MLKIVQIFHICFSFCCPPDPLLGLCPWTPLGDMYPADLLARPLLENMWIHMWAPPLYHPGYAYGLYKLETENVLLYQAALIKRLVGAVGGHSGYTAVVHNHGRSVNLWRPLNYTLPKMIIKSSKIHHSFVVSYFVIRLRIMMSGAVGDVHLRCWLVTLVACLQLNSSHIHRPDYFYCGSLSFIPFLHYCCYPQVTSCCWN